MNAASLLIIGALAGSALGAPGDGAVRDGNTLYRAGDYENAIQAYESAGDESALALFNRACALQRLGRDDEARELLQRVDAMTRRDDLAASARYNLGAASTQQARALASEGQKPEALDAYRRASRLFRDAYTMNPDDRDAARNIEVVGREAKALIDQMRAQQQAMQEMADQLEDLQQQQQQESEQNQQQSSSSQQSPQDEQQQQQQAAQRQQELNQQTQAAHDQLQQMQQQQQLQQQGQASQNEQDPLERAAQKMQDAMRDQQRAQDQIEQGEQERAAESQREAAEDLRDALREMMGEQETQNDPQQQQSDEPSEQEPSDSGENAESENTAEPPDQQETQPSEQQQQGEGQADQPSQQDGGSGEAGDENADPLDLLAEDLLEKEKQDRQRLQRIRAARRAQSTPVEKDW